jgi:hypothetical protein
MARERTNDVEREGERKVRFVMVKGEIYFFYGREKDQVA